MTVKLNHTVVWASEPSASAKLITDLLGRPAPMRFGHFEVVALDNEISLDFAKSPGPVQSQHYAFVVEESEFDAMFLRIRDRGLQYWADPMRQIPGAINHNDGGRGVYFTCPDGHYLELITRPYGG